MSLIGNLMPRAATSEKIHRLADFFPWWDQTGGDRSTHSGETVNDTTALSVSAYFAARRNISEDLGKLPFFLYRRKDKGGRERAISHSVYALLHRDPNPEMSPMSFIEALTFNATGGGGFAEIQRDGAGRPIALWPIHNSRVQMKRNDAGQLIYYVYPDDGGTPVSMRPQNMFHLHGVGAVGTTGFVMSHLMREAIGLGLATEKYAAHFFAGDGTPGILLSPDPTSKRYESLSDEAINYLRSEWKNRHEGSSNSKNTAILPTPMRVQQFTIAPEEAQFLETRQFVIEDLARWFRMPPHKIQHMLRSTFSNIVEQNLEYVIDTLDPWATRWQQEVDRKLLSPPERNLYYAEFLFEKLLRGDPEKRTAYYRTMAGIGAINVNEIRQRENLSDIGPRGDVYFLQGAMVPLERAIEGETKPAAEMPEKEEDIKKKEDAASNWLPVFVDAITRVIRKEGKALSRTLKRGMSTENFAVWAVGFYESLANDYRDALTSPARGFAGIMGVDNPDSILQTVAANYAQRAAREACEAHKNGALPSITDAETEARSLMSRIGISCPAN